MSKMLRIAGRGDDGTAKLIKANDEGLLQTQDSDVRAELESIKQTQAEILARLSEPINTQLTGSKVEYVRKSTDPKPQGKEGDSLFLWDTRQALPHDGNDWRGI